MRLIDYAKLLLLDSNISELLESNNFLDSISIESAYIKISKYDIFFIINLNNVLPMNVIYDMQDLLYRNYKIDIELNLIRG